MTRAGARGLLVWLTSMLVALAGCGDSGRSQAEREARTAAVEVQQQQDALARRKARHVEYMAAKALAHAAAAEDRKAHQKMADQRRALGGRPSEGAEFQSPRAARHWLEAGKAAAAAGRLDLAEDCFRRAVALDRFQAEAHRRLGHVRYEMPKGAEIDDLVIEGLLQELEEFEGHWVTKERDNELKARERHVLTTAQEELRRLRSDPAYARLARLRRNVEAFTQLEGREWVSRQVGPFVVFSPKGLEPAPRARLEQALQALPVLHEHFETTYARPFGLERDPARPLVFLVVAEHADLERFNVAMGHGRLGCAHGYFDVRNRWVVTHAGVAREPGAAVHHLMDSTLLHVAVHQVVDAYANRRRRGLHERIGVSRWCSEGLAEFLAAGRVVTDDGGGRRWMRGTLAPHHRATIGRWRNLNDAPFWRRARRTLAGNPAVAAGQVLLPDATLRLPELVGVYHYVDAHALILQRSLHGRMEPVQMLVEAFLEQREFRPLVAAQGAALWHFLHEHDGGRLVPRLHAYLRWELGGDANAEPPNASLADAGKRCQDAFLRAFEGVDLDALAKAYAGFLE